MYNGTACVSPVETSSSSPRRQKPITLVFVAQHGAREVRKDRSGGRRRSGLPAPPVPLGARSSSDSLAPSALRPYPSGLRPAPRPGRR